MKPCKTENEYLEQIIEPARKACRRYGYLPSVLIAQACLENGYGIPSYWDNPEIECLMKYNNMVGIKTELLNKSWVDVGLSVWPGSSITKNTPEQYGDKIVTIRDSFRIYDNPEQSFADFLCFLKYASNYGPGGTPKYGKEILDMKDPVSLIWGVSARGYATGQTYAPHVLSIIRIVVFERLFDVDSYLLSLGGFHGAVQIVQHKHLNDPQRGHENSRKQDEVKPGFELDAFGINL